MNEKFWWGAAALLTVGLIFLGVRYYPPLLTGMHVMVCLVLMIVVLLQSGRAADLAGAFGGAGSQTAFGPRGAATFLSKTTQFLAVVFMVTSLALATFSSSSRPRPLAEQEPQPATQQSAPASAQAGEPAPTSPPAPSPPPPQQ